MPGPSAASISRILAIAAACSVVAAEPSPIVKPPDGSWIPGDTIEIIAKAGEGRLLLDGRALPTEQPFPGVLRAEVQVQAGTHTVRLETSDGSRQVSFHSGPAPEGRHGAAYRDHPPVQVDCSHCHSVSRRGRFRFSGGCQACHAEDLFIRTHSHQSHELASCGMCHDAHGSSAAKLLVMPRERACKQCHN